MAKKLLIVDDEKDVREFAANFFRKRKIECIAAADGEEALEQYAKVKADMVLLDISMPGINGVETLRRIKEMDPGAKVVMVTGTKPEESGAFETCKQLGALNYVHKPLELDDLEKIVLKELSD